MKRLEAKQYAERRARYWARRAEDAKSKGTDNDVRFAVRVSEAYRRAGEAVYGADPKAELRELYQEFAANAVNGFSDMPLAFIAEAIAVSEVEDVLSGGAK